MLAAWETKEDRELLIAGQLRVVAPMLKGSGPWAFVGRDRRGWLVFEPADSPLELLAGDGHVVGLQGLFRVAVTPLYFWHGKRVTGASFMEVSSGA